MTAAADADLYRFLDLGEIIQEGDENPDDQACAWVPISPWAIGLPRAGIYKTIRRRVVRPEEAVVDIAALNGLRAWVSSQRIAVSADDPHSSVRHGMLKAVAAQIDEYLMSVKGGAR